MGSVARGSKVNAYGIGGSVNLTSGLPARVASADAGRSSSEIVVVGAIVVVTWAWEPIVQVVLITLVNIGTQARALSTGSRSDDTVTRGLETS